MTNEMILAIAVAVLLAAILVLVWVYERRFDRLMYESEMRYKAEEDTEAEYCFGKMYSGYSDRAWYVYRLSFPGENVIIRTTIKVFDDDDEDFNCREAEELCEILNAK